MEISVFNSQRVGQTIALLHYNSKALNVFFFFTEHLFFLKGQKWRNLRIKLTPTFTSGRMKMMFPTMIKCGEELKKAFSLPASEGQTVDVKDYLSSFTTDVIASCAFGLQINAFQNPNSEFRKTSDFLFRPTAFQALLTNLLFALPRIPEILRVSLFTQSFFAHPILSFMKHFLTLLFLLRVHKIIFQLKSIPPNVTKFFLGAVKDTIEYREKNNVQRNDFMQLLIELKNKGKIEDSDIYKHDDNNDDILPKGCK